MANWVGVVLASACLLLASPALGGSDSLCTYPLEKIKSLMFVDSKSTSYYFSPCGSNGLKECDPATLCVFTSSSAFFAYSDALLTRFDDGLYKIQYNSSGLVVEVWYLDGNFTNYTLTGVPGGLITPTSVKIEDGEARPGLLGNGNENISSTTSINSSTLSPHVLPGNRSFSLNTTVHTHNRLVTITSQPVMSSLSVTTMANSPSPSRADHSTGSGFVPSITSSHSSPPSLFTPSFSFRPSSSKSSPSAPSPTPAPTSPAFPISFLSNSTNLPSFPTSMFSKSTSLIPARTSHVLPPNGTTNGSWPTISPHGLPSANGSSPTNVPHSLPSINPPGSSSSSSLSSPESSTSSAGLSCTVEIVIAVAVTFVATTVLVVVTTFAVLIYCKRRAKKGSSYVQLAPTVYFDDDDDDE